MNLSIDGGVSVLKDQTVVRLLSGAYFCEEGPFIQFEVAPSLGKNSVDFYLEDFYLASLIQLSEEDTFIGIGGKYGGFLNLDFEVKEYQASLKLLDSPIKVFRVKVE